MIFDITEIDRILNNIDFNNPEDWEYNKGRCWEAWQSQFFGKNSKNLKIDRDISFVERIDKMKRFEETDNSEESFQKLYPDYEYDEYKSPWDFNFKIVSKKKIQKVAFELQHHIPLEYNPLCDLIKTLYWCNTNWSFNQLSTNLMSYDQELYLKSRIYIQAKNNKSVA